MNNPRYEFNFSNPEELYDKKIDVFYPLKREVGYNNYLYDNFLRGSYIMVHVKESSYTVYDNQTEHKEWYGIDICIGGFIIETIPATIQEVYNYLNDNLTENLIDEYFSIAGINEFKENEPFPDNYRWIAVFPVTGSNEGHYVHVELITGKERNLIFLAKTFRGKDHAWEIAKKIGSLLHC